MCSNNSGSTQPFSDSAELRHRIAQTEAEYRGNSLLAGRPCLRQSRSANAVATDTQRKLRAETHTTLEESRLSTQGKFEVAELIEAFSSASIASLPDARLIFASSRYPAGDNPAIIPLPQSDSGWEMAGVVQRTRDINFNLRIPYFDPPCDRTNMRAIPLYLQCVFYYNPANDNCVLVNNSYADIYLASLASPTSRTRLCCDQSQVIEPGMWRISVNVDSKSAEEHLVDFLMLRRQFTITLHEGLAGSSVSVKRLASDEHQVTAKRRRRQDDVTEVLFATTANSTCEPLDAVVTGTAKSCDTDVAASQKIARPTNAPFLDLSDGDVAVIGSIQAKHEEGGSPSARQGNRGHDAGSATTYKLQRLERIADTPSASVFTSRHSELAERTVAKIIRYRGKTADDLIKCAAIWKRETTILEKLQHPNIISLKAFDGRVFAIFVEHLPPSLHRGFDSPFKPSDARAILRGTSSALTYLADQRIMHNDIKPANIAYSPTRGPVILDFGLATTVHEKGLPGGTPWYIPPDLILKRTRGTPGDVWALGITMLYVLGKTTLPEKTTQGWLIRNVLNRGGEARECMINWLHVMALSRARLDRAETVEDLVFQMLEPESNFYCL